MRIKYIICLIALTVIGKSGFAQYAKDAVKFSTSQTGTTSRIKGLANANVAVGGDLTSVSGNPAGLGFFTRSEISITPEFNGTTNNSTYLGQSNSQLKNAGNLNNASAVFYSRLNTPRGTDKTKGWLSLNFGVGYNRTNDFGEKISFGGTNPVSTINDYYATLATSSGVSGDFVQGYASDHALIDRYSSNPDVYEANNPRNTDINGNIVLTSAAKQANAIMRTGGQSEFNIAIGANHSNKLYLGLSLGITSLNYNSTNLFNETGVVNVDEGTTGNPLYVDRNYNSTYAQYQTTRGAGINAKVGLIYKLLESVRLGAQITSPTYMSVDDIYTEALNTQLSSGTRYASTSPDYSLTYTMNTPFKAAGGVSIFVGKFGFLTGDIEYVNYSSTRLHKSDDFDPSYDNAIIRNNYKGAVNLRGGAEIRLPANIMLRGGYGVMGSPLKTDGKNTTMASGGFGFRVSSYYFDAAYQRVSGSQIINPYLIGALTPVANVNRTSNNLFLTLGMRF